MKKRYKYDETTEHVKGASQAKWKLITMPNVNVKGKNCSVQKWWSSVDVYRQLY